MAIDGDGAEDVHAGFAGFGGGTCTDIHVHVFDVAGAWRRFVRAMEVDRNSGDDAVNPFAACGADFHGLGGIERVENRRQARLRQPLESQVAIVCDSADYEARLVYGRDDQAMRRAAADGDDHIAEVVHDRMERRELRANLFRELLLVA